MGQSDGWLLAPFFELRATLARPVTIGVGAAGERRMVAITGGSVSGRIAGTILPGGADWQVIRPDGITDIDARYHIRTDDGALIEVRSRGIRHGPPEIMARLAAGEAVDPALYYFRTAMRFETSDMSLGWLSRLLAVARGERRPDAVHLQVYEIG